METSVTNYGEISRHLGKKNKNIWTIPSGSFSIWLS